MKICLMSYRGNPYCGGQGIYVMYLARELVKLGHEVHLIDGPPYTFEMEGVISHRISNHNYFNKQESFVKSHKPFDTLQPLNLYEFIATKFGIFPEIEAYSIRAYKKLKELTKKHKFDIIHDNQSLGYGFILIKLLGIPFVSTIHHPLSIDRSTWFEYPSNFRVKMKRVLYYPLVMQSFISKRMDHIVTVSHDAANEIHKAFGVKKKKMSVVYNGLESQIFKPVPGVKKRKNSLIFVGNVEDRKKGIIYLLKALSIMKNKVHLTLVDGGAPNHNHIPGWIDKFGLNDRITFTGNITTERLVELYSENEIAVAPSLYEGFGFPAAEALACELPLVAATGGALPEVVGENKKAGMLVPPRDAQALADALDYLIDNPKERVRLGKEGRKRVQKLFTWENSVKELVEVYEEVIHANR
jgi:glycosyltransferase involved in cell wall biosynthesis